jgi:DNA-binding response OmpR family regulator
MGTGELLAVTEADAEMTVRRFNIVLIEDAEPDVFLVREALERSGLNFTLETLDDGEKGVEYIEKLDRYLSVPCPDLVLLDLNLPKKSGVQVIQRLRESKRCINVPVMILTSSDSPNDRTKAAQFSATYFRKPSGLDEFMKLGPMVKTLLESRG